MTHSTKAKGRNPDRELDNLLRYRKRLEKRIGARVAGDRGGAVREMVSRMLPEDRADFEAAANERRTTVEALVAGLSDGWIADYLHQRALDRFNAQRQAAREAGIRAALLVSMQGVVVPAPNGARWRRAAWEAGFADQMRRIRGAHGAALRTGRREATHRAGPAVKPRLGIPVEALGYVDGLTPAGAIAEMNAAILTPEPEELAAAS